LNEKEQKNRPARVKNHSRESETITVGQQLDLWFIVFCTEMMYLGYGYSPYLMKASVKPAALTFARNASAFALTENAPSCTR